MAKRITHEDLTARVTPRHFDLEMQELAEAFNDMISRLETSFKHIEEFSSHVAHELKTPLTIMRGESELALRKERDPKDYQRAIRTILSESERMLRTIEDLLLLTRLNYRPEALKFEQIDFIKFLKEVYDQEKVLAAKKDIKMNLHLNSSDKIPVSVKADKLHLRRLFLNIIDNAIKYTPSGGKVTLAVTRGPNNIRTAISDTGQGIRQEDLTKIFEFL